jgi:Uma2 family endonuclease
MAGHAAHSSKLTYDDYVTLPNDGRRYEILDGELVVSPAASTRHQYVSMQLSIALGTWIRDRRLGVLRAAPTDVMLADTTVVQPDLLFVSTARKATLTSRAVKGPPELVIEILSESTSGHDRGAKLKRYGRYGVARYWIVDIDACTLEVYRLHDGAYELEGTYRGDATVACDVPAGLELHLADVWAD